MMNLNLKKIHFVIALTGFLLFQSVFIGYSESREYNENIARLAPSPQSTPVLATPPYTGIDIMFIVDQSGSMGGDVFGRTDRPIPNDPEGFRFIGPQYALDWLSSYRQVVLKADNTRVRMSLLAFGSYPEVQLNWTPLVEDRHGNPIEVESVWEDDRRQLQHDISVERFGYTNYGLTDFVSAFDEAKQMFDRLPPLDSGERHLRAIVVLTDGAPCTELGSSRCGTQRFSEEHLAEVSSFVGVNFPAPDYQVFVVAFNDIDDPNDAESWLNLQSLWEDAVCPPGRVDCPTNGVSRIRDFSDLAPTFNEILTHLVNFTQPPIVRRFILPPTGGTVTLPPFQQVMNVNLFKNEAVPLDAGVAVSHTTLGFPGYAVSPFRGANDYIEVRTINDPYNGDWTVQVIDPDALSSIIVDSIATNVNVLVPERVSQYKPMVLQFSVLNASGTELAYNGTPYPLTVSARLYDDKTNQLITPTDIVFNENFINNTYRYTANWTPIELPVNFSGDVRVEVTAEYQYNGQTETLALNETLATFQIDTSTIDNRGVDPISILEGEAVSELLAFVTSNGAPLTNINHFGFNVTIENLTDPSSPIEAFSVQSTSPTAGELNAVLDNLTQPGRYSVTTVVTVNDGTRQVEIIDSTRVTPLEIREQNQLVLSVYFSDEQNSHGTTFKPCLCFPNPQNFYDQTTTQVVVEIRDKNEDLVYLNDITGNQAENPSITLYRNNKEVPNVVLEQGVDGRYYFSTQDIGTGDLRVEVSAPANLELTGDYRWGRYSHSATIARTFPSENYQIFLIIFMVLVVAGIILAGIIYWLQRLTSYPLQGLVTISALVNNRESGRLREDELITYPLNKPRRNTRTFGKGKLPPELQDDVKQIVVTTERNKTRAEQKQAKIIVKLINGGKREVTLDNNGQYSLHISTDDIEDFIIRKESS